MAGIGSRKIGLKVFESQGDRSYLSFDRLSKEAILIDPSLGMMHEYQSYLAEAQLTLSFTIQTGGKSSLSSSFLQVGSLKFEIIRQSSSESVVLLGEGLAFTGNFELSSLDVLPGAAVLLPRHFENDLLFSTLQRERDRLFGGVGQSTERVLSMSVDKLKVKLQENNQESIFIDVREESEYQVGHIPGMINIPISEVSLYWRDLAGYRKVFLACLSGSRGARVAKNLIYLGFNDVAFVQGGYQAWLKAGYPSKT